MIEVVATEEFWKHYEKLPLPIQKKAEKQERIFRNNPLHPSLNTEKLKPKKKQVWSFRVDRKYRVFFRFIGKNKALFLTIGPHDWIYKIKF
ncbi:MAG: type II toxin-antitoxin system RelE/ParE family toxin [Candidatus Paceibacteria bacterium]